ncbi:MAG: DUF2510 domain-containing protein [Microbacteriaceae bacterium]|nr:DUF2510 domain-containing protein [Microbacteriaceae bacterium]
MSTTLETAASAGWYADPADDRAWRWWDGSTWTEHVRERADVVPTWTAPVLVEPEPVSYMPDPPSHQPAAYLPEPEPVAFQPEPTPFQPEPTPYQPEPTPYQPEPTPYQPEPEPAAHQPEPTAVQPDPPTAEPAPAVMSAPAIPQPGDVAAAPAPRQSAGGQVSSIAAIPVTDQLYWHSSAAEVIEVPRLHHGSVSGAMPRKPVHIPSYVRDWQDLGSPDTAGIWLLASLPLLSGPIAFVVGLAVGLVGLPQFVATLAFIGVLLLLCWIFGSLDRRALTIRGYHAPSLAWMLLLPPFVYFIMRGKAVRRENKRAWPPELLFFAGFLLIVAGAVLSAVAAISLVSGLN